MQIKQLKGSEALQLQLGDNTLIQFRATNK